MNKKIEIIPNYLLPIVSGILSLGLILTTLAPSSIGLTGTVILCSVAAFILLPTCTVIFRYCVTFPKIKNFNIKNSDARANLTLALGIAVNLFYSVYKLTSGLKYSSVWFISVAIYYTLQSLIKSVLLTGRGQDRRKLCFSCGLSILFLNTAVGIVTFSLIFGDRLYFYTGMDLPPMILYTLFRISATVIFYIASKGKVSPIYSAAKCVNMSTAVLSLYSLQTALLDKYGIIVPSARRPFNFLLGSAVTVFLISLSVHVIRLASNGNHRNTDVR